MENTLENPHLDSNLRPIYNLIELGLEDYEENELVLNTVHDLMIFFQENKCKCKKTTKNDLRTCYEKVGFKQFFERHLQLYALEQNELELFVKAQLMSFETTSENSVIHSYRYNFSNHLPLCQPVYIKLCGRITQYMLKTLQDDLQINGLSERLHKNIGRVPKTESRVQVDLEVALMVKQFLLQYADIFGLPSPMRHLDDSDAFVYLPTGKTYTSVYNEFKTHFYVEYDENIQIISNRTFRRLWHELVPNIKFQPPSSDLCDKCEMFKAKMIVAKSDVEDYEKIKKEYEEHHKCAFHERMHYNNNIEKSKTDPSFLHICYDWAQNVGIPYSPQQVGSIYFKTPFAVHIFGVCKTGEENRQLNYIIAEDEFPCGVSKGANTTLNMVFNSLKEFSIDDVKTLQITCDNCTAQNKNNLTLWFWSWLMMFGWFDEIIVNFMIPGHTKFICDSFFGQIKKVYRNRLVNIVDDIENIVNISSKGNETIRCNNELGWIWHDFNSFLKDHFIPLSHIRQYCQFRFKKDDIGKVYASKESNGIENSYLLLKNNNFDPLDHSEVLSVAPLFIFKNSSTC
ncbi:MAG: hypothetical protein QOK71_07770 [Nitrososphaeraceae archaeon]|nr:hypothetical protein [Nitrososphaeraceae archaeon]